MTAKRSLEINPEPLRIVPQAVRDMWTKSDPYQGRCESIVAKTGHRCFRFGSEEIGGRWLCWQHARIGRR